MIAYQNGQQTYIKCTLKRSQLTTQQSVAWIHKPTRQLGGSPEPCMMGPSPHRRQTETTENFIFATPLPGGKMQQDKQLPLVTSNITLKPMLRMVTI